MTFLKDVEILLNSKEWQYDLPGAEIALEAACHVAKKFGIAICKNLEYEGCPVFWLDMQIAPQGPYHVFHDIAHYQIASAERRHLPEFGLGSVNLQENLSSVVSKETAWIEERLASILGIVWAYELGVDWQTPFKENDWHKEPDITLISDIIKELHYLGLLKNGHPVQKLKSDSVAIRESFFVDRM